MKVVSVTLPPLMLAELDDYAHDRRLSRSEAARQIIGAHLERLQGEKGEPE